MLLSGVFNFLSFIVVFSIVVFIHELGHYTVARACGVKIKAFSIGFGKMLFSRIDRRGTKWAISVIPFGGYVSMYGEDPLSVSKEDGVAEHEYLFAKSYLQRIAVYFAGPIANILTALLIFLFTFTLFGILFIQPIITTIQDGSPADIYGLAEGDEILYINDIEINSFSDVTDKIRKSNGESINFIVSRNNEKLFIDVKLDPDKEKRVVGISSNIIKVQKVGIFTSIGEAFITTYRLVLDTFYLIGGLFTGNVGIDSIGGPIMIAVYSGASIKAGFLVLIRFIAK